MIEVGEYARNKEGKIFKIIDMYYSWIKNIDNEYIKTTCVLTDIGYINKDEIVKHSKNIIDLIEVGDYVKSKDGIEGKVDFVMLPLKIFVNGEEVLNEDIKSIVTKEQFKNIEYIVEE